MSVSPLLTVRRKSCLRRWHRMKLSALGTVRRATLQKIGCFAKQDIRELCPSLSTSSIEGALCRLVASGELKREGQEKHQLPPNKMIFFSLLWAPVSSACKNLPAPV